MKKIFLSLYLVLLLSPTILGQNIKTLWLEIDSLEHNSQIKTLQQKLYQLHTLAKKENDIPSQVKTLLLSAKYETILNKKGGTITTCLKLDSILKTNPPIELEALIHNMLAQLYENYFQAHEFDIANNPNVLKNTSILDLKTWSSSQFHKSITYHYLTALKQPKTLNIISASDYAVILTEIEQESSYQSSLFDILAFRAIDYFKNPLVMAHSPKPKQWLVKDSLLTSFDMFSVFWKNKPHNAPSEHALYIFKLLIDLHTEDVSSRELIHIELERLRFCKMLSQHMQKDSLYLATLKQLAKRLGHEPEVTQIYHAIGQEEYTKPNKYTSIINYLKQISTLYPNSFGAIACQRLIEQIEFKQLNVYIESLNPINTNIAIKLNYRNLDTVYFKLIRLPLSFKYNLDSLKKLPKNPNHIKTFSVGLNNKDDFKPHNTIISLGKLSVGQYLLYTSSSSYFEEEYEAVIINTFRVSNIAILESYNNKAQKILALKHRISGKPIKKAKVHYLFIPKFSNSKQKPNTVTSDFLTTSSNKNGMVTLNSPTNRHGHFLVFIHTSNDSLKIQLSSNTYSSKASKGSKKFCTLFTDRLIYKPNETVHFSGIYYSQQANNKISNTISNKKIGITAYDKNHTILFKDSLTTDEYGVFSSSFSIPKSVDGLVTIRSLQFVRTINVSEYKRPNFYIRMKALNPNKDSSVNITGIVNTYSNSALKYKKVFYRVSFQPYSSSHFYGWGLSPKHVIYTGDVITTTSGKFRIQFNPLKKSGVYHVLVWVTDSNGEQQEQSIQFSLVDKSQKEIDIQLVDYVKGQTKPVILSVKNPKGEILSEDVTITVWPIFPNQPYYTNWSFDNDIDVLAVTENEFYMFFPKKPYFKTHLKKYWKTKKAVFFNTITLNKVNSDSLTKLILNALDPGVYRMLLTTKNKDAQKEVTFNVYDPTIKENTIPEGVWIKPLKDSVQINNPAKFLLGSAEKKIDVLVEVRKNETLLDSKIITLSNTQKIFTYKVNSNHEGKLSFEFSSFFNNQFWHKHHIISVPFDRKKLNVSIINHSKKTFPGGLAKIDFLVKDYLGNPQKANITLSVFDKSLESFSPQHTLTFFPYFDYASHPRWTLPLSYQKGKKYSTKWNQYTYVPALKLTHLNWFYLLETINAYEQKPHPIMMSAQNKNASASYIPNTEKRTSNPIIKSKKDISINKAKQKKEIDFIPRKNFKPLAFFSSSIQTNIHGKASVQFKIPESLTEYKLTAITHTQKVETQASTSSITTHKDIFMSPNMPSSLTEEDVTFLKYKVENLSKDTLSLLCNIEFKDPVSKSVIKNVLLDSTHKAFLILPSTDTVIGWNINTPVGYENIIVTAKVKDTKSNIILDGVQNNIKVHSNKELVTHSLTFVMESKDSSFINTSLFKNTDKSSYQLLKLDYYSNPIWSLIDVIQTSNKPLPKHAVTSDLINAYFINQIALKILEQNKDINNYINEKDITSKLEEHQDIKSTKKEYTPWLQIIEEEKKQQSLLKKILDTHYIKTVQLDILKRIDRIQGKDEGINWLPSDKPNPWITSEVIKTFGILNQQQLLAPNRYTDKIVRLGIRYITNELDKKYLNIKHSSKVSKKRALINNCINKLYALSYFSSFSESNQYPLVFDYLNTHWVDYSDFQKAQLVRILHANGQDSTANLILKALLEKSIIDATGLSWKEQKIRQSGYEDPILFQTTMIHLLEQFSPKDSVLIKQARKWLLLQKRIQGWSNLPSTTNMACLSLLNAPYSSKEEFVDIIIGNEHLSSKAPRIQKTWSKDYISKNKSALNIKKQTNRLSWGALHFQTIEKKKDIENSSSNLLKLDKHLFLEVSTDSGLFYKLITPGTNLKVGDRVLTRLTITTRENVDFIVLKDKRTSCLEPIDYMSKFESPKPGFRYYKSVRNNEINYFFQSLQKDTYVLSHLSKVNLEGVFISPNAELNSYYAPEYNTHSNGNTIRVSP